MKSREPIRHIWQNYDLNLEDWKEGLLENRELNELPTDVDDDTLREEMYELNNKTPCTFSCREFCFLPALCQRILL